MSLEYDHLAIIRENKNKMSLINISNDEIIHTIKEGVSEDDEIIILDSENIGVYLKRYHNFIIYDIKDGKHKIRIGAVVTMIFLSQKYILLEHNLYSSLYEYYNGELIHKWKKNSINFFTIGSKNLISGSDIYNISGELVSSINFDYTLVLTATDNKIFFISPGNHITIYDIDTMKAIRTIMFDAYIDDVKFIVPHKEINNEYFVFCSSPHAYGARLFDTAKEKMYSFQKSSFIFREYVGIIESNQMNDIFFKRLEYLEKNKIILFPVTFYSHKSSARAAIFDFVTNKTIWIDNIDYKIISVSGEKAIMTNKTFISTDIINLEDGSMKRYDKRIMSIYPFITDKQIKDMTNRIPITMIPLNIKKIIAKFI